MAMEENRLTHNVPTWNTRNPTSKIPSNSPLSQPEPNTYNIKLMNRNTQACKTTPNTKDKDISDGEWVEENNIDENGTKDEAIMVEDETMTGRERLKRHREEVKGHVKVPENWGQEKLLNEWIDYTTFDALLAPRHSFIVAARDALIADVRKARSQRLRIHSTC